MLRKASSVSRRKLNHPFQFKTTPPVVPSFPDFERHLRDENSASAWSQFKSLAPHQDILKLNLTSHYLPLKTLVSLESNSESASEKLELIWNTAINAGHRPALAAFYDSILKVNERENDIERARNILRVMMEGGVQPTIETLNLGLSIIFKHGSIEEAKLLMSDLLEKGVRPDSETYRILIVGSSSDPETALEYFEESLNLGISTHPLVHQFLVSCWCAIGDSSRAFDYITEDLAFQQEPDNIKEASILVLAAVLEKSERWDKILQLYELVNSPASEIDTMAVFLRAFLKGPKDLKSACRVLTEETIGRNTDITSIGAKSALESMYQSILQFLLVTPDGNYVESDEGPIKDTPVEFCRDLVLDMSRNQIPITPEILEALVCLYCRYDHLDDAMQTYLNFKAQVSRLKLNTTITIKVYNTLLASLAANFRMKEFSSVWGSIQDTADESTVMIAVKAFIQVNNVQEAMKICRLNMQADSGGLVHKPFPLDIFISLFESCAITGSYKEMSNVLSWIRRELHPSTSSIKQTKPLSSILSARIAPISQSIAPLIDALPADGGDKSPLLVYDEFLALGCSLPYSLYTAVINYYATKKDMVAVAKTMSLVIAQSKRDGESSPRAATVTAFLKAARSLCGRESSSSVLKLIGMEKLPVDGEGWGELIRIAAKHGWVCEVCEMMEEMGKTKGRVTWKFYGEVLDLFKEGGYGQVLSVYHEWMENAYPEVVGEWMEHRDRTQLREMKRARDPELELN